MERFGTAVQQFGGEVAGAIERVQLLEAQNEIDEGTLAYDSFLDDAASDRLKNTDFATHRENFDKRHDQKAAELLSGVKSKAAQGQLANYFRKQRTSQGVRIEAEAHRLSGAKERARLPLVTQQSVDAELDEIGTDGQKEVQNRFNVRLQILHGAGHLTDDEVEARKRTRAMMTVQTAAQRWPQAVVDSLEGKDDLLGVILSDDEKALLTSEDMEFLKKDASGELAFQQAQASTALEAAQEQEQQQLVDRFVAGDFANIRQDINSMQALTAKDKIWWAEKAGNWAKQVNTDADIVTDPLAEAALQRRALDVSTGAVTRAELYEDLIEARYGGKPTIDDDTFQQINAVANREHKTYQANAMKEAYAAGSELLSEGQIELIAAAQVTEEEDINAVLKRLGGIRKQEEENFRQYKRAMSQWFEAEVAAGRDPNDDDIYKKSRAMLVHYRDRPLDESIFTTELGEEAGELPQERKFGKPGAAVKTGEQTIGTVNEEGFLVLNADGLRRLLRIASNDVVRAREIMAERGFREPD